MAIQVTESAANKIIDGLIKEGYPDGGLRLGVKGGGCSGLNYVIRFEESQKLDPSIKSPFRCKEQFCVSWSILNGKAEPVIN